MERIDVLEPMSRLNLYDTRAAGACPRAGPRPDPGDEAMTAAHAVLVGGTGAGKSHLAIAIARACNPQRRQKPFPHRR